MFVSILCFCLLFYAIREYNSGHKVTSTFIFILFVCNGFGFFHKGWVSGAPINKYYDFGLLYLFYIIFRKRGTTFFSNSIHKLFGILVLYSTISFIVTIVTKVEIFSFSLKTYRTYLLYLSFIAFQGLNKQQLKKLVILVCIMTVSATVVYVTQPLHKIAILDNMVSFEALVFDENVRYRNIPELLYYITCFTLVIFKFTSFRTVVLLGMCGMSIVLSQHRAVMLGFIAVLGIYLLISRQMGKIIQFTVVGIIGFALVGSMIISRFNQEKGKERTTTMDDIHNVINMDYRSAAINGYDDEGGTLAFRVLLFVERFDYFVKNPQYMLTGVGMRHADSPYTGRDFKFVLGSMKYNKETGTLEPSQITSSDLVWLTPFMRFGLLGLFLYILITYRMLCFFYKNKDYGIVTMSAFLYYVFLIIISLKNYMLFGSHQLILLFLLIELMEKVNVNDSEERLRFLGFNILSLKEKYKTL